MSINISLYDLVNIDELVYTNDISKKHQKRIDEGKEWLKTISIPYKNPPKNSSYVTLNELEFLRDLRTDGSELKEFDNIEDNFSDLLEGFGFDRNEDYIDDLVHKSRGLIYVLKYHYNRPRPSQVAEVRGIDINQSSVDSAKTPSYPSGLSTQAYLLAIKLATKYPSIASELYELGENISYSRVLGKVHYPSDYQYGKILGDSLARSL